MLIQGDIHDIIKTISTNSIDLIYTNPPFGITNKKWDKKLDWDLLWPEIWRVLKPTGIAVIHASMPFTYDLIRSQKPRYHYTWIKNNSTNFFNVKYQPLRKHEEILIFYKKSGTYNPQMIGDKIIKEDKARKSTYYNNNSKTKYENKHTVHVGNYPTTVLSFPSVIRGGKTISDKMIEYFIKTYSMETDTILDMSCHSNIVSKLVENLNRKYIGVDINPINYT
tara:strand:- start:34 stop:702 length:669 start_codon:yes stop_codon:yes gene_type:complete